MVYFNLKTNNGTETLDELNCKDFKTRKNYINELARLKNEYFISQMNVYISQKACKEWNK
jgi:hypothetical protein